jgi:O-antigen/teichoic acid export membrane protein
MTGGLRERLKVLSWSGVENSSRQVLALLFFFAMARYLQPSDVGVFALAVAVNSVFGIVIDEPIGEALVQKPVITDADWDTGFTVNLLLALLCLVLALLAGGLIARLLQEPRLAHAVPVLSVAAVIGALGNIHKAYLSRALRFRAIAQSTLAAHVLGGTTGVVMAVLGFGYWAQIGALFVVATVMTALFWVVTPWRPRLRLDWASIRSRSGYFASYSLVRSVYQLRDQGPLVIFGLLGGVANVGFLGLAVRVVRSIGQLFEELTSRPVLSLLSREQHEVAGFAGVLIEILALIALAAFPAFMGLAAVGPTLIPLLFGPVWAPAGSMLPWICAVLGGWLALHVVIVSLRARGLGSLALKVTTTATVLDIVLLAALAPLRLEWALIGWAARSLLSIPVAVLMLGRFLGVSPSRLVRAAGPPLAASAIMVACILALQDTTWAGRGLTGLVLQIAIGAAVYGLALAALLPRSVWRRVGVLRPQERVSSST